MNVLVTGSTGFIGSNLVDWLISNGHNVVGIDIDIKKPFINEIIPNHSSLCRYAKNVITPDYSFIWDDINQLDCYPYVFDNGFDIVYHLAASADIKKSFKCPTMDFENNVMGTNVLLEMIRKYDIKRLVFASTSAVYGEATITPTPEDYPDMRPISMYASSKICNEAFIHSYSHLYGIKSTMFRFANVVGNRSRRGVTWDFYMKLKKNPKVLRILGNGKQTKSYFDVEDCIEGFVNLPFKRDVEVYNLGNSDTLNVKQLADVVCDELDLSPRYIYSGGDRGWPGDAPITILDISRALSNGWKINYSCEEAIRRTVRYLVKHPK